jgi:hypothetical protein
VVVPFGLIVARFELLYNGAFESLVDQLAADIGSVSPATQVVPHALEIADAGRRTRAGGPLQLREELPRFLTVVW